MEIRLCLIALLLPAVLAAASRPPTADEIRASGGEKSELTAQLERWLDAYPKSAEGWPADDVSLVIAHLVGLGQYQHPSAAIAAEDHARRRAGQIPLRLDRAAEALSLAARVRLQLGHNGAALALFDQGSKLCQRGLESESEATYCAFLLRDRAMIEMRLGRYDTPADHLDQAMTWLEPYPHSAAWVVVLNSAADLACWRGEVERCLEGYRRATEVAESQHGVDSATAAYGYLGVGWAAALSGEWGRARSFFERAERVWSHHLGPEHPRLADALVEYGELLRRAGDARAAAAVLHRAVGLREARLGTSAFDLPRALDALGLTLIDLGDLPAARQTLNRSRAIRRQHRSDDHVDHAQSMSALARLAQVHGDLPEACRLLTQAVDLLREAHGSEHPAVAEGHANLAELYIDSQPDFALQLAARAKAALAAAFGNDHPTVARAWWLEARAHLAAGTDPIPSALQCEAIGRRHLRRIAAGLSEDDLLDYARTQPEGAELALEALLAAARANVSPPEARIKAVWQTIARSRGLVFEALAERRRTAISSPVGRDLATARQALARLLVAGSGHDPAAHARQLSAARERVEQAERSLLFRGTPRKPLDISRLLARLAKDETLLAYRIFSTRSETRLAAFVAVGATGQVAVHDLGPWRAINSDLRRVRQALTGASEAEYRQAGTNLRRKIWDPIQSLLTTSKRVLIVADGELSLLSLAALPSGDGYLIESGPSLHMLSAERDLLQVNDTDFEAGRVLVVGDPDFGPQQTRPDSLDRRIPTNFAALPQARQEAEVVAEAWRHWLPGVEVQWLQGGDATEDRWRRGATGAMALHLATHGFFLDTDPAGAPPRILRDGRGVGGLDRATPRLRQASLSGFALAHANRAVTGDGTGDGIITRQEIEQLDLASARLVVLSFCDSGLGDTLTGEGIFGLTRAFRGAGASSLVLALAPISDRDSQQFMEHFYPALLSDGLDVDQAVQRASLALLKQRRQTGLDTHPFHWASFVSVGSVSSFSR